MKQETIQFADQSILASELQTEKIGIDTLIILVGMLVDVIETLKGLLGKKVKLLAVMKALKAVFPFIKTFSQHSKKVLAEIKDLSTEELTDLALLVSDKSTNTTITDILYFIQFITILKKGKE
ncbi:hypothetical protein GCM10011514_16820 [Emticicia aquatilis]|uniref:Uncharacterized protein n=1 Tax=Emticicia aquatilis TaxID=1537369 RepID=A0A916YNH1_9BACT|nr:hypothetical protein [Emticicia aquatilis]GGD53346.1 hypothetical protein GCM10011514_16820 [Emticicia aquatilis]